MFCCFFFVVLPYHSPTTTIGRTREARVDMRSVVRRHRSLLPNPCSRSRFWFGFSTNLRFQDLRRKCSFRRCRSFSVFLSKHILLLSLPSTLDCIPRSLGTMDPSTLHPKLVVSPTKAHARLFSIMRGRDDASTCIVCVTTGSLTHLLLYTRRKDNLG